MVADDWTTDDRPQGEAGRMHLPTPFSFYVSPTSPPSPTVAAAAPAAATSASAPAPSSANSPHSSQTSHVSQKRFHAAPRGTASSPSPAASSPSAAVPATATRPRRPSTEPSSPAPSTNPYAGFLPARYGPGSSGPPRRASAAAGPDRRQRRRSGGYPLEARLNVRRATLSPLSSGWTVGEADEAGPLRPHRSASEGGHQPGLPGVAAHGNIRAGPSITSHIVSTSPQQIPGKVGSLLSYGPADLELVAASPSPSSSPSPADYLVWESTAPDLAEIRAMHPASTSPSQHVSYHNQQHRQHDPGAGYQQNTAAGAAAAPTLLPYSGQQQGQGQGQGQGQVLGGQLGRSGSDTQLDQYFQGDQRGLIGGSGQRHGQFQQQQQHTPQQHLSSPRPTQGAYEYRSHPSSPKLFSSSLTPSPLIGGQGGRRLSLLPDQEQDSHYLLNQYLGGGAGLYRPSGSNPASFNGSSYAHSYGATSDFGDDFDFAAFGLEDAQAHAAGDTSFGQGEQGHSGGRSYEPSDYGGEETQGGGLQQSFNFGSGGALADLNLQQQQQQGANNQENHTYSQGSEQQQQQQGLGAPAQQSGQAGANGAHDMPYRDLMGGPGSLLIGVEQAQNDPTTCFDPNQQGPSQQGFFSGHATDANDVIYAEPTPMSATLHGAFPPLDSGPSVQTPQYGQAPAPSQAQPVAQMAPHLFDGNRPSEFARRMNSEASEMSISNESEPSSRQNSLANKSSMQFGGSAPHNMSYHQNMGRPGQQDGRRSTGSLGGFPYPQFPGVAQASKPQSPPQLIIPESPLPTAGTIKKPSQRASFAPPPQPSLNTLLPPANPHLPYGAHLPNMSPIGPGGPSINIVPSTPTSALKDNVRGIWERMAMQAKGVQQQPANSAQPQRQPSMLASQPMGERRASHAGVFDQSAEVDFEALLQQVGAMGNDTLGHTVPGTAPSAMPVFQFNQETMRPALRAPGQVQRQRSRSESYMTAILPELDTAMSHEQLMKLMMGQQGDGVVGGYGPGGDVDMSGSAMVSVSGSPGSIDPKVLNPMDTSHSAHGSPYIGALNGQQQGNAYHLQLDQFGQPSVANSAPPWQTTHVVSGPEAFGANFIVANDGRRIPFESMYKAGGLFPNQAESSMRTSIAHSDVSSDGGGAGGGGDMAMYDMMPTSPRSGHRRAVQSEDMGRGGRWQSAEGNDDTANFLNAIVHPSDGSLLPPQDNSVGHPRMSAAISHHRRASSPYARDRSSSVVSSASSAGGSGNSPELGPARSRGLRNVPQYGELVPPARIPTKAVRAKVTTPATQMASEGRRTHDGQFICPVPGCGSTFTRHFNLKGHLRSHNEERPFKCTFEGCTKSFARQHDCKRHMQLHVGLKPFQCEGCARTFARLDALSRHHKTEAGLECALNHPLPTNPDGSLLSESKYRAEMARRAKARQEGVMM